MSTERPIPSRTTRDGGTTGTLRDTPRHRQEHPQVHTTPPPRGLTLEHLGTRPQAAGACGEGGGRGAGEAGRPQRTWRQGLAPRRPERACPCVRACVPARARRHLWEERCALRPGLPGWRGAGGAVAMARGARPHTNGEATGAAPLPARLPPPAPSFRHYEVTPLAPPHPQHSKGPSPGGSREAPGSGTLASPSAPEKAQAGCKEGRGKAWGGCPAWVRAPKGHGSWERRCRLGMGVAILGGWEIKGGT